jgi:hypothetical protein
MADLIRTSISPLPLEEAIVAYLDSEFDNRVRWPREIRRQLTRNEVLDRHTLMDLMSSMGMHSN